MDRSRKVILAGRAAAGLLLFFAALSTFAHPSTPHVHRGTVVPMRILVGPFHPMPRAVFLSGKQMGSIGVHVEPEETTVTVDDAYRGTAGAFDGVRGTLFLMPGVHWVTLQNTEGESWSTKVRVVAGQQVDVVVELQN